jgi:hypothetical protein
MVLANGVIKCWGPMQALLEHIPLHDQVFMHNTIVDRSGIGSNVISEDLWDANVCVLIEYSSCNVS